MAKVGMWHRDIKREKMVANKKATKMALQAQKKELRKKYHAGELDLDEVMQWQEAMQKMPRNASRTRVRNRCSQTGRPRGFIRRFGVSRNVLRERASEGMLPGVVKSSW